MSKNNLIEWIASAGVLVLFFILMALVGLLLDRSAINAACNEQTSVTFSQCKLELTK